MIRYALTCDRAHDFDSWFQSAEAFDGLLSAGMLSCPDCGSSSVGKSLRAPQVRPADKAAGKPARGGRKRPAGPTPDLTAPASAKEAALAELRHKIEASSEYVGPGFAAEARKIHDGAAPERSIWGEARLDEARRLVEDGIPVAPLPFLPRNKAN
jgi:hypothetical protein